MILPGRLATSLGLGNKCRTSIQCFKMRAFSEVGTQLNGWAHCFPRGFPFTAQAILLCHRAVTSLIWKKKNKKHFRPSIPTVSSHSPYNFLTEDLLAPEVTLSLPHLEAVRGETDTVGITVVSPLFQSRRSSRPEDHCTLLHQDDAVTGAAGVLLVCVCPQCSSVEVNQGTIRCFCLLKFSTRDVGILP